MEGWGKIGVQSASVLYPNSCYNESCYIEVQVYHDYIPKGIQVTERTRISRIQGQGHNQGSEVKSFFCDYRYLKLAEANFVKLSKKVNHNYKVQ